MAAAKTPVDLPAKPTPVPGGVVHPLLADLRKALIANRVALTTWKDITPLARNEFICWVEDAGGGRPLGSDRRRR